MRSTYRALHTACHRGTNCLSDRLNSHPWAAALQLNVIYFKLVRVVRGISTVIVVWEKGYTDCPTNSYRHMYCKESGSPSWP